MDDKIFGLLMFLVFFGWIPVFTIVFAIKLVINYIVEAKIKLKNIREE